ncbi:MAG: hypothetical protein MI861_06225 [Pirellulales bacterium]|nr:hypothetical protein [Pirellulales bacterium]
MKKVVFLLAFCGFVALHSGENVQGGEPGWSLRIIATGDYRDQIKSTPIELRPYRPLHFYGNAVRRKHYRGSVFAFRLPQFARPGKIVGR